MKRRGVMKLFAVVALAGGCEAGTKPEAETPAPVAAPKIEAKPAVLPVAPVPAKPRTLKNGRPACGNVVGKGPMPSNCEPKP